MTSSKSKTLATWLALVTGLVGGHRIYLRGITDPWAWLHLAFGAAGLAGLDRVDQYGQDDRLAWILLPLLGLSLSAAALTAIIYGLTSDEIWNARHNAGGTPSQSGWIAVLGVVLALLLGGTALMATVAYSAQRFFEAQISADAEIKPGG